MGNMVVCNSLGTIVFDILFALGFPWFLHGIISGPVEMQSDIIRYVFILFGVLVFRFGLLIYSDWKLDKAIGYVFSGLYLSFMAYIIIDEIISATS